MSNRNELNIIHEKYFSTGIISTFEDDDYSRNTLHSLIDHLSLLKQYDKPDMYAKIDNHVLAIEHFEFNASKSRSRKGSLQNEKLSEQERQHQKEVNKLKEQGKYIAHTHSMLGTSTNLQYYHENFTSNYNNHYIKIGRYVNCLKEDNILMPENKLTMCFFSEDTTLPISSCFNQKLALETGNGMQLLMPPNTEFFWDIIDKKSNNLDCIFFGQGDLEGDSLFFLDLRSDCDFSKYVIKSKDLFYNNNQPLSSMTTYRIPIKSGEN